MSYTINLELLSIANRICIHNSNGKGVGEGVILRYIKFQGRIVVCERNFSYYLDWLFYLEVYVLMKKMHGFCIACNKRSELLKRPSYFPYVIMSGLGLGF